MNGGNSTQYKILNEALVFEVNLTFMPICDRGLQVDGYLTLGTTSNLPRCALFSKTWKKADGA
jgi:hypothetical protein